MVALAVGTSAVALYGLQEYGRRRLPHGDRRHLRGVGGTGPARASVPAAAATAVLLVTAFDGSAGLEIALWVSWAAGRAAAGRLRAQPAGRAGRDGGAGPAPGRDPGGGSPPPGRRGAGADRPRPARLGRPQHGQHLGAGRGGRPCAGRTARGRPGRPARHQARQPQCAGRAAGDAEHAPLERDGARSRRPGSSVALAGRELTPRASCRGRDRGERSAVAAGRRHGRLPDRAGVAHQRDPPRRPPGPPSPFAMATTASRSR